MGRGLAWIGVVVFSISWFVPVVKGQDLLNAGRDLGEDLARDEGLTIPRGRRDGATSGPGWLPGWQAARFAWDLLTGDEGLKGTKGWKDTVLGATCLTNVLMVLAIFVLLGPRGTSTPLGLLLVLSAVLNGGWVYLVGRDRPFELSTGYYLWAASFLVVGVAFLRGRDRGALHPV